MIFTVPEDYIVVDEQMRPVIPEPPAPESWNDKTLDVPFNEELTRGDRARFSISYDKYSKLILSNKTESPAKVIWNVYRNGQKLPDNEQGPVKYRTKRLYKGENRNLTYNWKPGDEIEMECYEGKLQVEVKPEDLFK